MEVRDFINLIWNKKNDEIKDLINKDNSFIEIEDDYRRTPLYYAANYGNFELVSFLVEKGANVNVKDKWGYTPIFEASKNYKTKIVNYLMDKGADINIIPSNTSGGLVYNLLSTRKKKDERDISLLLKKIIDQVQTLFSQDLAKLISNKQIDLYKYALETKSIDEQTIISILPDLFYLKDGEALKNIKYLFENNFLSINTKPRSRSNLFLFFVDYIDDIEILQYLLDLGVSIDEDSKIALLIMAKKPSLRGVKFILENGVDINYISEYGRNALHSEASSYVVFQEEDISETFLYLEEQGIDIVAIDNNNKLPLHELHKEKKKAMIKYFFEKTVNALLDKKDNKNSEEVFKALFSIQEIAPTKKEKTVLIDSFLKFPEYLDHFLGQLNDPKVKLRDTAVKVLIESKNFKYLKDLKDRSIIENNKPILKQINDYLKGKETSIENSQKELRNIKDYEENTSTWFDVLAENENQNIPIPWLKLDKLSDVLWRESSEKIQITTIKYFLRLINNNMAYFSDKEYSHILNFVKLIDEESLEKLFQTLYIMPNQLKTDDKWIFNILFLLAEFERKYLNKVHDKIELLLKYSRAAFAGQIIGQMIFMRNQVGIKKVDWYSRKMKHKGVKNAAHYALSNKARELNLSFDELRDSLIPDFGLNENKELTLDYGSRRILVQLMSDFKFIFQSENGKIYKTLPKANKKDDPIKSAQAIKFFKNMKKEIKEIIKVQKERLEFMLKVNNLKQFSYWQAVFIKNPILNTFASNLFWGVYPACTGENIVSPVRIFRYNEDKTLTDLDDNEVKIKDNDLIGLVHPVDLSIEELNKAKEILDDFEIVQPIEQINRIIYKTNKKDKELNDFEGFEFDPKSSHYKLLGFGWERGQIVDNGCFEDYFMHLNGINITLDFSGADMYLEYLDKNVIWGKVRFKNSKNLIPLNKIDKRIYSEVYKTLKSVEMLKVNP